MIRKKIIEKSYSFKWYVFLLLAILCVTGYLLVCANKDYPVSKRKFDFEECTGIWKSNNSGSEVTFTGVFPEYGLENKTLAFLQQHMKIRILVNGVEKYALQPDSSTMIKTTGYSYVFLKLQKEYEGLPFNIILKETYGKVIEKPSIYIGNKGEFQFFTVYKSRMELLSIFLLYMAGFSILFYGLFSGAGKQLGNAIIYLGLFSMVLATWRFSTTDACHLVFSWHVQGSMLEHIMYMLLPVLFSQFAKHFYSKKFQDYIDYYCIFSCCIVMTRLGLQVFGIKDLGESLDLTLIDTIGLFSVNFVSLLNAIFKKKNTKEFLFHYISFFVMMGVAITGVICYYAYGINSNTIAWVCFIYIMIMGIVTIKKSQALLESEQEIDLYKKLSYIDGFTNTYNRNAFIKEMRDRAKNSKNYKKIKTTDIIIFDLNNLKTLNDEHGHQWGDEYIILTARCIKEAFFQIGKCYRIGGDEFCVLVDDYHSIIEDCLKKFKKRMKKVEEKLRVKHLHVAVGSASFDSQIDKDLYDTKNRADQSMYKNKEELKEKNSSQ